MDSLWLFGCPGCARPSPFPNRSADSRLRSAVSRSPRFQRFAAEHDVRRACSTSRQLQFFGGGLIVAAMGSFSRVALSHFEKDRPARVPIRWRGVPAWTFPWLATITPFEVARRLPVQSPSERDSPRAAVDLATCGYKETSHRQRMATGVATSAMPGLPARRRGGIPASPAGSRVAADVRYRAFRGLSVLRSLKDAGERPRRNRRSG